MDVNRKQFQEALQKCMPGVETGKTLLEGADTFIFKGDKIFSYNDNISVSVPFPIGLEGAVKAKELYNIVSKSPGDEVKFAEAEGNSWKLKIGNATVELTLLESSVMDHVNGLVMEDSDWGQLPTKFTEALALCRLSNNNSQMSGIYIQDNTMVATDILRINWYTLDKSMSAFWISDLAAAELIRISGLVEYSLSDAWVHFRAEDGSVFSCKKLHHTEYPYEKLKELVEMHKEEKADIGNELPMMLSAVVERAATFSMDMDSHPSVRLTFQSNFIEVFAQRSTGKFKEKVPWDTPMTQEFDPVVLYVDFSMVSYGLKRSKEFYIKQLETKKGKSLRIVFKGTNITHILSTFQIKGKE